MPFSLFCRPWFVFQGGFRVEQGFADGPGAKVKCLIIGDEMVALNSDFVTVEMVVVSSLQCGFNRWQ